MELHINVLFKASLTVLVLCLNSALFSYAQQLPSASNATSKSYLTNDSYSLYPPWLVQDDGQQGRLDFSFRTSHRNGLLLYTKSKNGGFGEFFKLSLVNGDLIAEILDTSFFGPSRTTLSERLNDDGVHTVVIQHNPQDLQFTIRIDGRIPINIHYNLLGSQNRISESGVYVGGVPDNLASLFGSSAPLDPHFIGCIMDIRYSTNSTAVGDLMVETATEEVSVVEGCVDFCASVDCGLGMCVPRYPVGICDCRGGNTLGADCTEDPSEHARAFTRGSPYLCYDVILEPSIPDKTEFSVTLLPPLPLNGVIITGVAAVSNGGAMHSVTLTNARIVHTLTFSDTTVTAQGEMELLTSLSYKIVASVNQTHLAFTVTQQQGEEAMFEYQEMAIVPELSSIPNFQSVCLGGGALEGTNYVGAIENAFSDYFSLTEERNFDLLRANETSTAKLINFNGDATLSFQNFHTNAIRFSFDKRTTFSHEVFRLENDAGDVLSLSIVNEVLFTMPAFSACNYDVRANGWHHFEVTISPDVVSVSIDCRIHCPIATELSIAELKEFLKNPIEFARPHEVPPGDDPIAFDGCLQNFVFEQMNGDLLIPNLEVLTVMKEDDFSTSAEDCDHCIEEPILCPNTCLNRDFMRGDECTPSDEIPTFQCSSLPQPNTTRSPATVYTTQQPVTSLPPVTTLQPTPQTTLPPPQESSLATGAQIGIGVGILLVIILLVVIVLLLVCFYRRRLGQEGFYKTYETNERHSQVVHYSASLRELSTEVVTIETNGYSSPAAAPLQQSNGHSKEFYL